MLHSRYDGRSGKIHIPRFHEHFDLSIMNSSVSLHNGGSLSETLTQSALVVAQKVSCQLALE